MFLQQESKTPTKKSRSGITGFGAYMNDKTSVEDINAKSITEALKNGEIDRSRMS